MNEEFEKLVRSREFFRAGDANGWRGVAELAWQASRKQALEEAAKVADHVQEQLRDDSKPGGFFHLGAEGASVVLDAIRALQKE